MSDMHTREIVEHRTSLSFDATVERLVRAIGAHGMTVFAKIDHAANAREVGMTMPEATVLIYGSPKGGTPIMVAAPLTALDLPLRVLIRAQEDGDVSIAFHPIAAVLQGAGVPADAAVRLEPAQQMLLAAVNQ